MAAISALTALSGKWQGTNHLYFSPEEPVRKSRSSLEIQTVGQQQFLEIWYTWAFEEQQQEGRIILGRKTDSEVVNAVWFDTWHMKDHFMICEGTEEPGKLVSVKGSYSVPGGPDWGWQISIESMEKNSFKMLMHNITPEGEKMLAVEAKYTRQG